MLRLSGQSKLPSIPDKATSWLDASGWHHISFPTPYARDVRTRHKVLPKLLAKLVGPLAWDVAPGTPRALREAAPEFSERLSQPKQRSSSALGAERRSATTQILSAELSKLVLATVRVERPTPTNRDIEHAGKASSEPQSPKATRGVSLERLAKLAEPKRRRSKFVPTPAERPPQSKPRPIRSPPAARKPAKPGGKSESSDAQDSSKQEGEHTQVAPRAQTGDLDQSHAVESDVTKAPCSHWLHDSGPEEIFHCSEVQGASVPETLKSNWVPLCESERIG